MTRTWCPEREARLGASRLNRQHLVAQLGEGSIVLRALLEPCDGAGWRHHPAVRMWRGYERAFLAYLWAHLVEAESRGFFVDNFRWRFIQGYAAVGLLTPAVMPWWWGGRIHERERAVLVARFPGHYVKFWPDVSPLNGYWTPVPYVEGDHECRGRAAS